MAGGSTPRMARLNELDNPIPEIQRIALAHNPPPTTVNHKPTQKGILDSDFLSDALVSRNYLNIIDSL
jgi:hypothetical protein